MTQRILVIEDESAIAETTTYALEDSIDDLYLKIKSILFHPINIVAGCEL